PNNESWVSHCAPKTLPELAVHKAKIQELETCLKERLSANLKTPFILLSGPSGCGKTTTLNVLCSELNIEIIEWVNPVLNDYESSDLNNYDYPNYRCSTVSSDSQYTKFSDFLFRANRYSSLNFGGDGREKKLFLVKDFPNVFIQNAAKFHDLITKYSQLSCAYPCVFIVTDSDQSSNIKRHLFPPNLLDNLKMNVIKFNPISSTAMMKALQRIANSGSSLKLKSFVQPSKETLEEIVETSSGDIRSALLTLQFICTSRARLPHKASKFLTTSQVNNRSNNNKKESKKMLKKKSSDASERSSYVGVKDSGMSLFRVLGKVLHCKRLEDMEPASSNLPDHLLHHSRNSLTFNPDGIFDKSCLSSDTYCAFLHQNYPDFANSIENMSMISDYFSLADASTGEWSVKSNMSSYQVSLVTRSIAFYNGAQSTDAPKKAGWLPLHKPQLYTVQKKIQDVESSILTSFKLTSHSISELSTVHLPYLDKLTS
ncbi:hypothetical protein HELRODRAFT_130916, partial [Helobdella robusta]|uniref:AAA+ ATPase domain-containing protein n=1 Tax=Helobdella robusta TaxID=6412 RepID=T1EHU7_HELRO